MTPKSPTSPNDNSAYRRPRRKAPRLTKYERERMERREQTRELGL